MRIVDLLGKKFSKLKVIEKTEKRDSSGAIIWLYDDFISQCRRVIDELDNKA